MRPSRVPSTINAGSMADIAFLLLLFFLVSTTISQEKGIVRKLPEKCLTADCNATIAERNILELHINEAGELLVHKEVITLSELQEKVVAFLDNNGSKACLYCNGLQHEQSSDHPSKAVISLSSHRLAPYKSYISVQDELTAAYKELRTQYAKTTYHKDLDALSTVEMKAVQKAYPFKLSEISVSN